MPRKRRRRRRIAVKARARTAKTVWSSEKSRARAQSRKQTACKDQRRCSSLFAIYFSLPVNRLGLARGRTNIRQKERFVFTPLTRAAAGAARSEKNGGHFFIFFPNAGNVRIRSPAIGIAEKLAEIVCANRTPKHDWTGPCHRSPCAERPLTTKEKHVSRPYKCIKFYKFSFLPDTISSLRIMKSFRVRLSFNLIKKNK